MVEREPWELSPNAPSIPPLSSMSLGPSQLGQVPLTASTQELLSVLTLGDGSREVAEMAERLQSLITVPQLTEGALAPLGQEQLEAFPLLETSLPNWVHGRVASCHVAHSHKSDRDGLFGSSP